MMPIIEKKSSREWSEKKTKNPLNSEKYFKDKILPIVCKVINQVDRFLVVSAQTYTRSNCLENKKRKN